MKKFFIFALALSVFAACNNGAKGDEAVTGDAQGAAAADGVTYTADTEASVVNWVGSKVAYSHNGTIQLKEGTFTVKDGNITSGSFVIDMNSIENLDIEDEGKNAYFVGHLKGLETGKEDDFFYVTKYPTSKFVISKVTPLEGVEGATHEISGDLTLKDVTKNVTFKATVAADGNKVTAKSENFTIDRTQWNVKALAKILGLPADKVVSDDIGLQINLEANAVSDAPASDEDTPTED